jgi:hypothetical protein
MLEYFKVILQKVSFDKLLFEKELRKALTILQPSEIEVFKQWCYENFVIPYNAILSQVFSLVV